MLPFEILPSQLAELRTKAVAGTAESPTLVDVREPWEVETASIPGSLAIPMGEIPARAYNELDPDSHVIVVCHHGVRSLSVASWLRQQGFDRAQSLAGGIEQWSREIDPAVPRY